MEAANWLVAIATVAALVVAAWELRLGSKRAGEAHAREAWMSYLQLGLQNPDLSTSEFAMSCFKIRSPTKLIAGETIDSQRYLWFMDIMMEACESLINYFPGDYWSDTIQYNLELHRDALKLRWPHENQYYSKRLVKLVDQVLSEGSASRTTGEPDALP